MSAKDSNSTEIIVDDLREELPDNVFVLALPDGGIELRKTERGDMFAMTYSSLGAHSTLPKGRPASAR